MQGNNQVSLLPTMTFSLKHPATLKTMTMKTKTIHVIHCLMMMTPSLPRDHALKRVAPRLTKTLHPLIQGGKPATENDCSVKFVLLWQLARSYKVQSYR